MGAAMTAPRCIACGDPCRVGSAHCAKCFAWDSAFVALQSASTGIDDRQLRRALARLHPRESVRSLLARLTRRLASVEEALL